jgi:hypothetical protein
MDDGKIIVEIIEVNNNLIWAHIKNIINNWHDKENSEETIIGRTEEEEEINSYIQLAKPFLNKEKIFKRLLFAYSKKTLILM